MNPDDSVWKICMRWWKNTKFHKRDRERVITVTFSKIFESRELTELCSVEGYQLGFEKPLSCCTNLETIPYILYTIFWCNILNDSVLASCMRTRKTRWAKALLPNVTEQRDDIPHLVIFTSFTFFPYFMEEK